jgi:hypothetical protein
MMVKRAAHGEALHSIDSLLEALPPDGDYQMPFGKAEAQTKAAKWLWQVYVI